MPILYIITGPAGVGKSTISKELAMSSNKSVLIVSYTSVPVRFCIRAGQRDLSREKH